MKIEKMLFSSAVLASFLFAPSIHGGVAVRENIEGTAWPDTPVLITTDIKLARAGERIDSRTKNGDPVVVSQTFTPKETFVLGKICILYSTQKPGTDYYIRVQEVAGPEIKSYAEGANLLTDGLYFECNEITEKGARLLELTFTEADQITLKAGVTYALELVGMSGGPLYWSRRASDSYKDGNAFMRRATLNVTGTRDLALAIYAAAPAPK